MAELVPQTGSNGPGSRNAAEISQNHRRTRILRSWPETEIVILVSAFWFGSWPNLAQRPDQTGPARKVPPTSPNTITGDAVEGHDQKPKSEFKLCHVFGKGPGRNKQKTKNTAENVLPCCCRTDMAEKKNKITKTKNAEQVLPCVCRKVLAENKNKNTKNSSCRTIQGRLKIA